MPDAEEFLYKPSTGTFEPQRTPDVFKIAGAIQSGGNTALWTPASGKKFRILGVAVSFGAGLTAAAAADLVIGIFDAGAPVYRFRIYVPTAVPAGATGGNTLSWRPDPGNGYLSSAADHALNINFSFSLTGSGAIDAMAWGNEE